MEGLIPWSSNATLLVTVQDAELSTLGVYKPQRGERPLWDFPEESLGKREVAAFLISEASGWGFVPPTVYRIDAPEGEGSLQYFIPHDPEITYFSLSTGEKHQLQTVVLFDVIINNTDRKGGHILRDDELNYGLIDHGVTFHQIPKLRTVIWDFAGQPISGSMFEQINNLKKKLEPGSELNKNMLEFISAEELQAILTTIDLLLEKGIYPFPGEEVYPYPWPPV